MNEEIIRRINSYERNIPDNIDSAMKELDRRFFLESKESNGSVKARIIFRELLEDYTKGIQNNTSYILR